MTVPEPAAFHADEHPAERSLWRYISNEMGERRKTLTLRHLEDCAECRSTVARLRELSRRVRDLERRAISHVARQNPA